MHIPGPCAGPEAFRTCSDSVILILIIDEITNPQDPSGVRVTVELVVNAMRGEIQEKRGHPSYT